MKMESKFYVSLNSYFQRFIFIFLFAQLFFFFACEKKTSKIIKVDKKEVVPNAPKRIFRTQIVKEDVKVRTYFEYMNKLLISEAWRVKYPLSEHLIVWANPWIIDTLANTDYYRLQEKGVFSYDQKEIIVLKKGTKLIIPDSMMADSITKLLNSITIDVNVPEYKLRILSNEKVLHTFLVRVGKHTSKYLAMAKRTVELETHLGVGKIAQVNKNADYKNPVNNKEYFQTHRDDGKVTLLPRLPWLVPEINNTIYGQLIHPTTNPATLGGMHSNGCIGMREADVWCVYYYAPISTKVVIRYDLKTVNEQGDTILLADIYRHN